MGNGHVSIGKLTVYYGNNAMHWAWSLWTRRWGFICFRPTTFYRLPMDVQRRKGKRFGSWPWYFYVSPNATPWAATFAIGPGIPDDEKKAAARRRKTLGHRFNAEGMSYEEIRDAGSPAPGAMGSEGGD